jgi:putative ABC transport system substrate-binding protein
MRRRDFMRVMAGSTVAWSPVARAQKPTVPAIGFLASRSPADSTDVAAAFRKGLDESGFAEDCNVTIEYRWARGQYDRLPALAAELVKWPVAVIAAFGPPAARAAKAASTAIPVVFASGGDPVAMGLVASLNRPGGNVSGVNLYTGLLGAKRLGLLRELIPSAGVVAVLRIRAIRRPTRRCARRRRRRAPSNVRLLLSPPLTTPSSMPLLRRPSNCGPKR